MAGESGMLICGEELVRRFCGVVWCGWVGKPRARASGECQEGGEWLGEGGSVRGQPVDLSPEVTPG